MQNVFVSLSGNILKVSCISPDGYKSASAELAREICSGGQVTDVENFSQILNPLISELTTEPRKKLLLNMIIDPEESWLFFASVNKRDGDLATQILADISHKLEGVTLDELYYSYEKIAPFVYQFVGVRKVLLEAYLEISNKLGIALQSVISWVLLLPKYTGVNEPSIFINLVSGRQTVALSELNGVFYAASFDEERSPEDLQKMIKALSIYKRAAPIANVYTLGYDSFSLDPKYHIEKLTIPNSELENAKGFESHLLVAYCLDTREDLLVSQANFVNLFPLPVVERKSSALMYAGVTAGVLLLVGGLTAGYFGLKGVGTGPKPSGNNVLSETSETTQSTGTAQSPTPNAAQQPVLNKADLKIRVENGSGVAGVAAKTKDLLASEGYTITSIGDAEVVGRQNTLLKFKKDKVAFKDNLIDELKSKYLDIVVEDDLAADTGYDLLIVVGTNVTGL